MRRILCSVVPLLLCLSLLVSIPASAEAVGIMPSSRIPINIQINVRFMRHSPYRNRRPRQQTSRRRKQFLSLYHSFYHSIVLLVNRRPRHPRMPSP